MPRSTYIVTVGIECHVQLKTKTKLFSSVSNDARIASPNTLISHIDLGLPGALPVLNQKAIELATRAALALKTQPQHFSKFDRKHYFYPDLPMGYQITQFYDPIIRDGLVEFEVNGTNKKVRIHEAHLESDAGKSSHPPGKDYSLVDLNRAGTPLLEIVSEPDMHSAEEAGRYARELYLLMRYADVSDADLYQGNMRFDVNVSVSKEATYLGTRTETKNLNSFKSVERAVDYEAIRQIDLLEKGQAIMQETRGWDEAKQKTTSQRGKEEAHDYRYMPEPDIPPVIIQKDFIDDIAKSMPVMPWQWRERLNGLGLDNSQTDILLESELDDKFISYLDIIDKHLNDKKFAKFLVNNFVNLEIPLRRDSSKKLSINNSNRENIYLTVFSLINKGQLSSTGYKLLLNELLLCDDVPESISEFAAQKGYIQLSDENEIEDVVLAVLKENPQATQDVKNGEQKAIGFLVGQIMKKSQGKANPQVAQSIIKKHVL